MLNDSNKVDAELELLDTLSPTNSKTLEYRELTAMNLAISEKIPVPPQVSPLFINNKGQSLSKLALLFSCR